MTEEDSQKSSRLLGAPKAPGRVRKLHVGHFALMRAVVQGVDVRLSWDRYLRLEGEGSDQRVVRSTIAWIRDEFAAAAKREDRPGTARLVRLDVSKIADPSQDLPRLDVFAEEAGLEDYSETEQIAAYEERYGGATARLKRRGRLIQRQLEALTWLQALVAQPPSAGDRVAAWLNPALAELLEAADIFTLAQLAERISGIGRRWHSSIKALGEGKAQRIVEWLRDNQDSTGLVLGPHTLIARSRVYLHELDALVAPATDIRPLEKFIVPRELDGSRGLYRRPQAQCLLKANNDYQAILAWLRSKHGLTPDQTAALKSKRRQRDVGIDRDMDWLQALSNTQRAYRKEAERFLLWAIIRQDKALSSMTNEDCVAYREFIADPTPASHWCGPRSRERWSPLWRPFEGPLGANAQRQAITILKNLYSFLVDQNYLMGNPWSAIAVPKALGAKINTGRSLTLEQWDFVKSQLEQLPETSANRRLRFALSLLYATGLRQSEVVAATVDDLVWVEYAADKHDAEPIDGWLLKVVGKGQKTREVPVPKVVIAELGEYLLSRGLHAKPKDPRNAGAHLLGKASDAASRAPGLAKQGAVFDPTDGVAATTLYDQIKRFFEDCAGVLRTRGDSKGADRLGKASTHWMRHSHASHAIAAGMELDIAQRNLGHVSLATTTIYVTSESKRRLRAVEKFSGR